VGPLTRSELRRLRALRSPGVRARRGAFLLEGFRAVETALGAGRVDLLALTERALEHDRAPALLEAARDQGIVLRTLAPEVLAELSDTRTPAGVLARVPWDPPRDPSGEQVAESLERAGLRCLLCLDAVADPGNAGTLLRTADALGIPGVLLGKGTVEAGNPKTARAAAGSLVRLDYLAEEVDLARVLRRLAGRGWSVWRAEAGEGSPPPEATEGTWALVLGSEGDGISDELREVGEAVHLPRRAGAESLNVAVAGGILMYLMTRGRTT